MKRLFNETWVTTAPLPLRLPRVPAKCQRVTPSLAIQLQLLSLPTVSYIYRHRCLRHYCFFVTLSPPAPKKLAERVPPTARVRLPKRPPTPSESDETEDSESSEETSETSELTLPVGADAEVRTDDRGFVGSFYEVTVTGHVASRGRGYYTVVYSTLEADDGRPLQETAAAADVRPRPPREGTGGRFALLEAVEAFHSEGWWAGVVYAVPRTLAAGAPRVYAVAFPTSRETLMFEEAALRPHRVFQAGRWVPAAELEDGGSLFREGTQVEVSQSAKNFGESWPPACVIKVIGATNFLVQYTHIRDNRERATEIIDSQYIRPVRNGTPIDSKYRAAPSCHVEVMHEGSWWPGVIRQVLGSGINTKYAVKLKSYETDMDDVECVDVLIVGYTQLRPHFDWDRKKWVRRLPEVPEEFVNGTKLPSKKRPRSSALSLYKEVGESSDKSCSYRGKKLKNADVVSEPTSSRLSDNSEIMHKSSSCPEETMTRGNAVMVLGSQLAPPSLPSMAGFAHLSHSSLAQSSHPEASSKKIITLSAPVSQSRQLQASVFGTFGQPRPIPQGPLLGMQSLNPQTTKNGTSAKSIVEARNTVSIWAELAKSKNGFDDVELRGRGMISEINTVSIWAELAKSKNGFDDVELRGRGMISEINSANCIDPTTTANDVGGSQQGGNSAVDDRLSESLAIQHSPFVKTSPMWAHIDALEIFSEGPQQRPHLNQFRQHGPEYHEGMAVGLMISFAHLAESINRLDVEDDLEGLVEGKMQSLSLLEAYGFNVGALRSRLETLLYKKNSHGAELHDGALKMLKEKIAHKETDVRELGMRICVLGMALHHLGLYARVMRHMMRSAVTKKISNAMEILSLKSEANNLKQSGISTAAPR